MPGFADYAPTSDYTKCPAGVYPATVVSAKIVMDGNVPKYIVNESTGAKKIQVEVRLHLDKTDAEGNPIELSRKFGYTFGKNRSTGTYSGWAQFVEAATGVAAGNPAQHHVGDQEVKGKRITVMTKNVESGGNRYTNIVDFLPMEEEPGAPAARAQAKEQLGAMTAPVGRATNIPEAVRRAQQFADEEPVDDLGEPPF